MRYGKALDGLDMAAIRDKGVLGYETAAPATAPRTIIGAMALTTIFAIASTVASGVL
jgi:hypothetical protein